jgi:hypothetical protein
MLNVADTVLTLVVYILNVAATAVTKPDIFSLLVSKNQTNDIK